jgi:m7GpppX diphosphatase
VIHETASAHESHVMQAFIRNEILRKQWIYKIIAGEREQDNVVYRCDDFVILPDMDAVLDPTALNWLVIFTDKSLTSMRCLRGEHIPMLQALKKQIGRCVPKNFEAPMLYFHYPPSVWQLHLHIAAPCDVLRTTSCMQRVCFLEDVICNLSIDPQYYSKATLTYILPSNHDLTQLVPEWATKIRDFIKVT